MSTRDDKPRPTEAELAEMSREELATLGMALDDVEVIHHDDPFPIEGTRAEQRAEREVAGWFGMAAATGLASVAVFLFWPWEYVPESQEGHLLYSLYTPVLGLTIGLSILGIGVGAIAYAKKLLPHETAVQQRGEATRSSEVDRQTLSAQLVQEGVQSKIARRSLIRRTAGLGAGAMGLSLGVFTLGGLIRDPWKPLPGERQAPLLTTGWASPDGEKVYLRYDREEITRVRPEDLEAGAIATVFPFRESERGDEEALHEAIKRSDNPVMLIRLFPEQAQRVTTRAGQEGFNFGDYYAYSKVCTHVGCPASLYEAKTGILLCPCHQSQFDLLTYAKPVFGPATRSLPQLPIEVDDEGYFVARSDFIEPIGPAFWERRS